MYFCRELMYSCEAFVWIDGNCVHCMENWMHWLTAMGLLLVFSLTLFKFIMYV